MILDGICSPASSCSFDHPKVLLVHFAKYQPRKLKQMRTPLFYDLSFFLARLEYVGAQPYRIESFTSYRLPRPQTLASTKSRSLIHDCIPFDTVKPSRCSGTTTTTMRLHCEIFILPKPCSNTSLQALQLTTRPHLPSRICFRSSQAGLGSRGNSKQNTYRARSIEGTLSTIPIGNFDTSILTASHSETQKNSPPTRKKSS